jgi:hypothetical protein
MRRYQTPRERLQAAVRAYARQVEPYAMERGKPASEFIGSFVAMAVEEALEKHPQHLDILREMAGRLTSAVYLADREAAKAREGVPA